MNILRIKSQIISAINKNGVDIELKKMVGRGIDALGGVTDGKEITLPCRGYFYQTSAGGAFSFNINDGQTVIKKSYKLLLVDVDVNIGDTFTYAGTTYRVKYIPPNEIYSDCELEVI